MITYELAKKLKDAGFPQEGINEVRGFNLETFEPIMFPSLSELIEECGEDFTGLAREREPGGFGTWRALQWKAEEDSYGSIPEEAVANLWLKLNQNGKK